MIFHLRGIAKFQGENGGRAIGNPFPLGLSMPHGEGLVQSRLAPVFTQRISALPAQGPGLSTKLGEEE